MPIYEWQCPVDGNQFELLMPRLPADERAACPECGAPSPLVWSLPVMRPDANWFYGETIKGHGYLTSASKIARARKQAGIVELSGRDDREAIKKTAEEARKGWDAKLEKQSRRVFEEAFAGSGVIDSFGEPTADACKKLSDTPISSGKDPRVTG